MARKVIALLLALSLLGALASNASARKRRHRNTCGTFCHNAGGLGGSPDTPPCKVLNRVIRVSGGVAAVTAHCWGRTTSRGALVIYPHRISGDYVRDGVPLGSYNGVDFLLRPGHTFTFHITLSRRAYALLRRRHSIPVDVLIELDTHPNVSANSRDNIPMRLA